jgi:rod shape determining protein RodA
MFTIKKNKEPSLIGKIDWMIILIVVSLNIIGLITIKNVSVHLNQPSLFTKQIIASIMGMVCMILIMLLDYKDLRVLSIPIYIGTLFLLIYVLIAGVGREETGTQGWIDLGPVSFQPSELGKVSMALIVAAIMEKIKQGGSPLNYLWLFLSCPVIVGLVLLQPDFGTSVVYMFMFACMLFVFGIRYKYIIIAFGILLLTLPVFLFGVFDKIFESFQIDRILSFLNPEAHSRTGAYQALMSIRYIGSGILFGVEKNAQKAARNVPESATDSIFAVIGEAWGFVGAVLVVILFTVLLLRCLYVSRFARDKFGSYIIVGLMAMFLFHFVENVGMNIGMLPITGIPLPFISYGGSSVLVNYIAVGIIVSISMRRDRPMFAVD